MNQEVVESLKGVGGKALEWFVVGALTLFAKFLYDKSRKVHVHISDWKIGFESIGSAGGVSYNPTPDKSHRARFDFTMRMFSKKPDPIGLHNFRVEFTQGMRPFRKIVFQDKSLYHSDSYVAAGQIRRPNLEVITLVSKEWANEKIGGFLQDAENLRHKTAWIVADTAEGKTWRWKITKVSW